MRHRNVAIRNHIDTRHQYSGFIRLGNLRNTPATRSETNEQMHLSSAQFRSHRLSNQVWPVAQWKQTRTRAISQMSVTKVQAKEECAPFIISQCVEIRNVIGKFSEVFFAQTTLRWHCCLAAEKKFRANLIKMISPLLCFDSLCHSCWDPLGLNIWALDICWHIAVQFKRLLKMFHCLLNESAKKSTRGFWLILHFRWHTANKWWLGEEHANATEIHLKPTTAIRVSESNYELKWILKQNSVCIQLPGTLKNIMAVFIHGLRSLDISLLVFRPS